MRWPTSPPTHRERLAKPPIWSHRSASSSRRCHQPASSKQMRTLEPGPAQVNQGASDLSWSSDSAALSFDLYDSTNQTSSTWVVPTGPGVRSLAEATRVPVDGTGLTWTGFFGKSRSGRDQGIGVASGSGDRQTIVTIDQHTGKVTSRLFTMPAAVCASVTPTPNGCTSPFSNPVIGDGEGTSVLVAGAIPYFYGSPTTSGASSSTCGTRAARERETRPSSRGTST